MRVLLSPHALGQVSLEQGRIPVILTRKQIEEGPILGTDQPVSQEFEAEYHAYYGWPARFEGPFVWGTHPVLDRRPVGGFSEGRSKEVWDPHLRGTREVRGYHVQADDGALGFVEDFVIDCDTWTIRYLIINTSNWWQGQRVLVAPQWIERVVWEDAKVFVNLTRQAIKASPPYSEGVLVDRVYEAQLHDHYLRPGYWKV
jgi:hypothetical protein